MPALRAGVHGKASLPLSQLQKTVSFFDQIARRTSPVFVLSAQVQSAGFAGRAAIAFRVVSIWIFRANNSRRVSGRFQAYVETNTQGLPSFQNRASSTRDSGQSATVRHPRSVHSEHPGFTVEPIHHAPRSHEPSEFRDGFWGGWFGIRYGAGEPKRPDPSVRTRDR